MEFQPKNLWEAVDHLLENIGPGSANVLHENTEREFVAITHHTNGRWVRNAWFLWWNEYILNQEFKGKPGLYPQEKPALVEFFNDLGITHPDDMSGIIFTTVYRKFHGKEVDLDGQVRKYKMFWEQSKRVEPLRYSTPEQLNQFRYDKEI